MAGSGDRFGAPHGCERFVTGGLQDALGVYRSRSASMTADIASSVVGAFLVNVR